MATLAIRTFGYKNPTKSVHRITGFQKVWGVWVKRAIDDGMKREEERRSRKLMRNIVDRRRGTMMAIDIKRNRQRFDEESEEIRLKKLG